MSDTATAANHINTRLGSRSALASVDRRPYPADAGKTSGIVWKFMSADPDVKVVGWSRIKANLQYQVTAYCDGEGPEAYATANALADQIDKALDMTDGSNAYGKVHSCERIRPIEFVEKAQTGRRRTVIGAIFRISVCSHNGE
jgi:hypothetical protein